MMAFLLAVMATVASVTLVSSIHHSHMIPAVFGVEFSQVGLACPVALRKVSTSAFSPKCADANDVRPERIGHLGLWRLA
ncbi:hypothetical protein CLAFUW4_20019 [Fulvia fulva]|uniref:uncharacterized protein n=1 Tax=Passalora fulva TaxID=5499 RepID=UPI002852D2CC|nr:uncharacterized protein CLAFUR5_20019 [Fulvia fulva]KAK4631630.1 hypothetical protein CLAFUR4_20019 [Fulvia fulva]KAK4633781.1 hypothetical protein CLAFUR0_20019 [Fulvia fulva]WMI38808.1 hypothetical protein CLAFUR5_20019 [Fulvia fulva]WPV11476.1 hypothetical protein CLAFUW4_20019 [Fulvia fulva]WPV25962.1 hypothetical protein CLAFUW7_20019 [Fulvia fulva]